MKVHHPYSYLKINQIFEQCSYPEWIVVCPKWCWIDSCLQKGTKCSLERWIRSLVLLIDVRKNWEFKIVSSFVDLFLQYTTNNAAIVPIHTTRCVKRVPLQFTFFRGITNVFCSDSQIVLWVELQSCYGMFVQLLWSKNKFLHCWPTDFPLFSNFHTKLSTLVN